MQAGQDVARVRLDNALWLFDEFVRAHIKHPDAATLRGLERRFAEHLQIQASYWSQIKSRSRQIGERLARQFEQRCRKPQGWLDQPRAMDLSVIGAEGPAPPVPPRTEDEQFIVDLVLSYYRRDPERARARLLTLLGEALKPASAAPPEAPGAVDVDVDALWRSARTGVAPLKRRR
jgi:hypothetical protein